MLVRLARTLRRMEVLTRPEPPDLADALRGRWAELPAHVKGPRQMLGRRMSGCEGTHGVFPRCDLACTPCYHGKEANQVRTDGAHTVAEVDRQFAYLRAQRGPGQHAQLIGGEVTLLRPDDHAEALRVMRAHGRKPMSMSHGDVDWEYLEALAVDPSSRAPRLPHLAFAGHFDSLMYGRRGIERPPDEASLHPYRRRFCELFARLEREHGVTSYLAHNMTVTPGNIDEVADVVRTCRDMGFRMFSFQPAAFVGNRARWKDDFRAITADDVWRAVERGIGARLHSRAIHVGDTRCNRTAYGFLVGDRYVPLLDEDDPRDEAALGVFLDAYGGLDFDAPRSLVVARLVRGALARPSVIGAVAGAARRLVRRGGGVRALRRDRPRPITFVVHAFMDAAVVRPAWAAIQEGRDADPEPAVQEAIERLRACSYVIAHPEDDMVVPACAQHSVLDPAENLRLAELLPLR